MNDSTFLESFEECTLPYEEWTHLAHVRVAWLYAREHDLVPATDRIRKAIRVYNLATETPEALDRGYHETITRAFMQLIWTANRDSGPYGSFEDFCAAHPKLLTKTVLQTYYSPEQLMTMEAKTTFVEPDICPLPE